MRNGKSVLAQRPVYVLCSDRQDAKETNNKGRERTEKQFLAILALPVRVCSQADLERALASGREK